MAESIKFDKVADIYDFYVNIGMDIPFFMKETENHEEEILELMCGTGRISIPLLEQKRKLVCVDYSQGMLDSFKKKIIEKNYPVEIIKADVVNLELKKKFKLALLPFHSFSEIIKPELQMMALNSISNHLVRDGIFICTLQNPKVRLKTADGITRILGRFSIGTEKEMIVSYNNRYEPKEEIVLGFQFYEIYDQLNLLVEKRYLEINFRPVENKEFLKMIRSVGMEVVSIYGDYSYSEFDEETSNFMIYKIVKR